MEKEKSKQQVTNPLQVVKGNYIFTLQPNGNVVKTKIK